MHCILNLYSTDTDINFDCLRLRFSLIFHLKPTQRSSNGNMSDRVPSLVNPFASSISKSTCLPSIKFDFGGSTADISFYFAQELCSPVNLSVMVIRFKSNRIYHYSWYRISAINLRCEQQNSNIRCESKVSVLAARNTKGIKYRWGLLGAAESIYCKLVWRVWL